MRKRAILDLVGRVPFRPFRIELQNGRICRIFHPEDLVVREGLFIAFKRGGGFTMFESSAVTSLRDDRRANGG
jgi:hypothetical protein